MAAAPKTLKVTARPSVKDGAFWSTSYWLFGSNPDTHVAEFTVANPAELAAAMTAWAMDLPLPEGKDGWALTVAKTTDRWPAGFKKFSERSHLVDMREGVAA